MSPAEANQTKPPTALHVEGRYIYADDDGARKLYKLSHSLDYLMETNQKVRIYRIGTIADHNDDGNVRAIPLHHTFDLVYQSPVPAAPNNFYARGMCSIVLQTFRPRKLSSKKGFNFHRIDPTAEPDSRISDLLFYAAPGKRKEVNYEWSDANNRLLATEVDVGGFRSLFLHIQLTAEVRDTLVSAWVLRVWWEQTKGKSPRHIDDLARRMLQAQGPEHKEIKAPRLAIGGGMTSALLF